MDIREIARRAKVSTATVSRAINRVPTVDPQLSKRVWKVVDELGYYPNTQARALVSGRSRIFGLIVSEITNPFFPEIVQTFENLAVENNYEILITSTVHDPKRMEISVRRMIERRVDGVAILTFGMEDSLIEHLRFRKVPLVFVQHLAALRHKRIAFVTGPLHLKSALARKSAFQQSMEEIGLPEDLIVEGDHTLEGGKTALTKLIGWRPRPTAILCSNDMTAIGVIREAYDLNLSIPSELSVIGFDDIRLAQFTTPPLTTVQMSQRELAKLAFQALMSEVGADAPTHRVEYKLVTSLILRDSTALAPAASERRKSSQ
jgi:DNA-binding LacI/PurR family transcriptional regulator